MNSRFFPTNTPYLLCANKKSVPKKVVGHTHCGYRRDYLFGCKTM